MKTKIINFRLIAILALIGFNVSVNSTVISGNNSNTGVIIIPGLELEEADLQCEAWMTGLKEFKSNSLEFTDNEIQIEDWMTTEFSGTSLNYFQFQDEEISLEDWMINTSNFNNDPINVDVEPEIEP